MHVSTIAHATATPPNKRTSLDDSCSPSFSGSSISTVGSDQHADAISSKASVVGLVAAPHWRNHLTCNPQRGRVSLQAPEAHTRAHQSPTLLAARRRKQVRCRCSACKGGCPLQVCMPVQPHHVPGLLQADDVPAITRALYSCISWFFPASPVSKGTAPGRCRHGVACF